MKKPNIKMFAGSLFFGSYLLMQDPAPVEKPKMYYETLTRAEIVDIVAEYDIKRVPIIPIQIEKEKWSIIMGLTFQSKNEMILNKIINEEAMKYTAIHEMMHVKYDKMGFKDQDEATIEAYGCRAWKEIYKKPCPQVNDLDKILNMDYVK